MDELTDLGVVDAAAALARRDVSPSELTAACLARIRELDGAHSHDGSPDAINAFVRVYEDDAVEAAARADEVLAAGGEVLASGGDLPPLLGVPIGLKDLYGVSGRPVTASSRVLHDVPEHDCDAWRGLRAAGMVLIGHTHTHEFAAGGTTDQVGNPWDLARSAGGSSGGSGAALAARMVPAATGTDTAGSLRIPSACCGTSTIKPTRGLVSLSGVVPLSWTLDHGGPMARSVADCRALLAAMAGADRGRAETALHAAVAGGGLDRSDGSTLGGARIAVSPRLGIVDLDPDVAHGLDTAIDACRRLGATIVEPPAPAVGHDVGDDFLAILATDMRAYHQRFEDRLDDYRPALREWVELGRDRVTGEEYARIQARRRVTAAAWADWFDEHRLTAVIEPTIPMVAPERGRGYEHAGTDVDMIAFTHFWDWTGVPVVALPAGLGPVSHLPVGVSLVGRAADDWLLLDLGEQLQDELGVPTFPHVLHE